MTVAEIVGSNFRRASTYCSTRGLAVRLNRTVHEMLVVLVVASFLDSLLTSWPVLLLPLPLPLPSSVSDAYLPKFDRTLVLVSRNALSSPTLCVLFSDAAWQEV